MTLIRHKEILPNKKEPFKNCILQREKYADILTNIISNMDEGFVMALNNSWGSGKTTFINMWREKLNIEGYKTIYFNAWENDYGCDPMTAILGELKSILNEKDFKKITPVIEKASIVAKAIIPSIIKSAANRFIESEKILEVIENTAEAGFKILDKDIEEYSNRKENLSKFKTSLQQFIYTETPKKPLIFFIDELDRCKPNYSVEILEHVKHFFSVPNIVFILSIDKSQLQHAVCGYYGSEGMNSKEYLRRFIDIEYSLPTPDTKLFVNYLFQYFNFDDFFETRQKSGNHEVQRDQFHLRETAIHLFSSNNFPLRKQEKFIAQTRMILLTFGKQEYIAPRSLFFLVYIKNEHPTFYQKIKKFQMSVQELINSFEEILPEFTEPREIYSIPLTQFIVLYTNTLNYKSIQFARLYEEENNNYATDLTSKLLKENSVFATLIYHETRKMRNSIDMKFLIDRIDISENIKS